ncbi:D-isomer specific 2-hydroxyacid dehydrogenase [Ceratobasidium sp. AG-I]|nr:D-isomer specific 2-hydroxyacid dehydrogenase [Ceratobasidium sp. AG-I]
MSKVVVTRHLGDQAMESLRSLPGVELVLWEHDRKADREWLLENARGAVALAVTLVDKIDKELIDVAGSSLKVVSTMSVGYDHIDVAEVKSKGIRLGFTPDVLTDAAADIGIMLALMASRNVKQSMDIVHSGKWPLTPWSPFLLTGPQLSTPNTIVGFLGFGRIAHATLARLVSFNVSRVLYTRSSPPTDSAPDAELLKRYPSLKEARHVTYDELARESDFIFLLAPGGPSSHHIVGREFLAKMKSTAILVNPGRGSLVDSDALAEALRTGQIWGAGLDVVDGVGMLEPNVPADHPLVREPRAVVLPHIGSATVQTRLDMAQLAIHNLIAGIKGEPMPSEVEV